MESLSPMEGNGADSQRPGEASTHVRSSKIVATKEQFAQAVILHSSTSKEEHLFTGVNYSALASFLTPSPPTSGLITSLNLMGEDFSYLVVHTYGAKGTVEKQIFDHPSRAQALLSAKQVSSDCSRLLFMRGFPSPDWLTTLGALYKVNPEFFRRPLDFLQVPRFFDLPGLPSSSCNFVDLKFTTIGTRGGALELSAVRDARMNEWEFVRNYQNQVSGLRVVGNSMVRKFSNHDETSFSLEQNVSCYVKNINGGFVALVWMDMGRSLEGGQLVQPKNSYGFTSKSSFMPVILNRHKGPLKPVSPISGSLSDPLVPTTFHDAFQNACLLPTNYGSTLNAKLIPSSAFYALSELFSFSAHSESQFLNFVDSLISQEMREYDSEMGHSIESFRYHRSLLEKHAICLTETLDVIRFRGSLSWLLTRGEEVPQQVAEELEILQRDYERLVHRVQALISRCDQGSKVIMENATLEESKKVRSQAAVYGRLSTLAFFFIPSTLATGIFGMNFVEFGSGTQSVWLYAVVIVPVLVVSTILAFPHKVGFQGKENAAKFDANIRK